MSLRERQRVLVDESACSTVARCEHCGATFGPYRDPEAARAAAMEHWDTWHRPAEQEGKRTCRAPGCDRDARAMRLCAKHYLRERRKAARAAA